jgi:DNA repair protein SbcC/Rad50
MRLVSLHLRNFRQHTDTHIDFDTGITGIIGPNGSGKTTLLEAVAWALYGMPAARGNRDSVRSYRAGPRSSVSVDLEFELGAHRYKVSRGLNNAELYLDGASAPIATSISGVTELLRRRLGMSHDEFFNTYFTGQKELSIMAAMTPTERGQFLNRVLGYERLRTAQGLVRDRRSAIVAETNGLRTGLPDRDTVQRAVSDAEGRVATSRKQATASESRRAASRLALDDLAPRWAKLQQERDLAQALASEIRVVDNDRAAADREVQRLDRELADIATARAALDALSVELEPLASLQAELRDLERSHNEEARRRTLVETARGLTAELERLRERRAAVENSPVAESDAAIRLAEIRVEAERVAREFEIAHTEWVRDRQEADTRRQALRDQLKDVQQQREQIVELGEDGICPICTQKLDTHFRDVLAELDRQIETITVEGKYYKARIEQLEKMPADVVSLDDRRKELFVALPALERRQSELQREVKELASLTSELSVKEQRLVVVSAELGTIAVVYDAERHVEVKRLTERLAPQAARASTLAARLDREPSLMEERERARGVHAETAARLADLEGRRTAAPFSENAFAEMRATYEATAAELRSAELAAVAAESELSAATGALNVANATRAELAKNEERLAVLVADKRLHDELDRVFTDLRTDLNQTLRPEISDLASRYIRELTDGRYSEIELDDQYNIIVLEDAIPKPVISGGEEDLANLVLRLSISEMIAERAGQSFSLLILDEVFGSLDEVHRHNVVDLLRRLQGRFEQVILITHIESVREGLDRVLTVRYDESSGSSRVEAERADEELVLDFQEGAAD